MRYLKENSRVYNKIARLSILLPMFVLCVTLTITFFVWRYVKNQVEGDLSQYFNFRVQLANNLIEQRLSNFGDMLKSARGLYSSSSDVSRKEFRLFIEALNPEQNYPGVEGVGFSQIIKPEDLDAHLKKIRGEGFRDYRIMPEGKRDIYTSVVYIEPFKDKNMMAFGYDMFSEQTRRHAMQTACDSNEIVISSKVKLVQETEVLKQPGFLMFLPVYKNNVSIETVEDRRKNLIGWVYSPFRMNNLMRSIFGMEVRDVDIEIYDGQNKEPDALMYDSNRQFSHNINSKLNNTTIHFIGEHYWTVSINSTPDMESKMDWRKPEYIGTLFTISSLLFVLLTLLLVKEREKAIAINRTKDKFFSIISHDLRSPFNGFLNLTEILAEQPEILTPDELKKLGEELFRSAQNQYTLLTDLLNWAKIQMDNFEFKPTYINLKSEVDFIFSYYQIQAKQKGIELVNEIGDDIAVHFDKDMLSVVFRNLISNSIKFTNSGGLVKIKAEQKGERILVNVIDNGVGIDPENIEKLFRIDIRFTTPGTKEEKGTGLGLMLCKEIIERHKGTITVESEPDKGSKFIFTLPA